MDYKCKSQQSRSVDSKKQSYWPIYEAAAYPCQNESFWNRSNLKKENSGVFNEGKLWRRSAKSSKVVKQYHFTIYEHGLLIYQNEGDQSKIKGWIQLGTIYFIRLVSNSENQKVVRLGKHKNFNLLLWDIDYESTFRWYKYLQQFCVSENFDICYTIDLQIGQGGFSKVYKVSPKLKQKFQKEQHYCAKVYDIKQLEQKKGNIKLLKQFIKKECSLLKTLDSPQILKLFEIIQLEDVLKFIKGGTLNTYLEYNGFIGEEEALQIILQIAYGLEEIHNTNHVHRDLKLENIMVESSNPLIIKIIDFGLCEFIDRRRLNCGQGTAGFIAPEVFKLQPYQEEADIFSLGVIMFTILTGQSPFISENHQELLRKNKECKINFNTAMFCNYNTVQILKKSLEVQPENRITLSDLILILEQKTNTQKAIQNFKNFDLPQTTVSYKGSTINDNHETKFSFQEKQPRVNKLTHSVKFSQKKIQLKLKPPQSQKTLHKTSFSHFQNPFTNNDTCQTRFEKTILNLSKEEDCKSDDDELPIEQINIGQLRISTHMFNSEKFLCKK